MDKNDGVLLDVDGNVVEGLPASYDNIDEQGNVLYLDEERSAAKRNPTSLYGKTPSAVWVLRISLLRILRRGNGIGASC